MVLVKLLVDAIEPFSIMSEWSMDIVVLYVFDTQDFTLEQ